VFSHHLAKLNVGWVERSDTHRPEADAAFQEAIATALQTGLKKITCIMEVLLWVT
jgi:hypothetical protein